MEHQDMLGHASVGGAACGPSERRVGAGYEFGYTEDGCCTCNLCHAIFPKREGHRCPALIGAAQAEAIREARHLAAGTMGPIAQAFAEAFLQAFDIRVEQAVQRAVTAALAGKLSL